jgi:uncharacterized protein
MYEMMKEHIPLKLEYWIIIIVYIGMQLFSGVAGGLIIFFNELAGADPISEMATVSYSLVFSFLLATVIVLFILRREMQEAINIRNGSSFGKALIWAIAGVFIALFAQTIAANIERLLGVEMGSENTQQILRIIESVPAVMFVSSVLGPFLEEIVFRKIIFGSLYKKLNFFLSAIISSVIFSLAHLELEHTLLYAAMGFTFAYLYVKTERIWVPIFAHVAMNTLVVLMQSVYKDEIERMLRDAEKMESFITILTM